jgi:hypothetical protein
MIVAGPLVTLTMKMNVVLAPSAPVTSLTLTVGVVDINLRGSSDSMLCERRTRFFFWADDGRRLKVRCKPRQDEKGNFTGWSSLHS